MRAGHSLTLFYPAAFNSKMGLIRSSC